VKILRDKEQTMNEKASAAEAGQDHLKTVAEIVTSAKIGVLTTITTSGALHSRPLAAQDVEFDGDLWFFTQDPSSKVDDIAANDQVNAAFESKDGYLSIAGTAEIVHDRDLVDKYWNQMAAAWFPEGKDDPTVALIKVHAESAEIWSVDEPRLVTAFKLAKARVTGEQPDIGENRSIEL
jgi:general stress protein 26